MRRMSLSGVEEGMRLARAIHDSKGKLLVAEGVQLTNDHLRLLQRRGCSLLYVHDQINDDIQVAQTLPAEVQSDAVMALQKVYQFLAQATERIDTCDADWALRSMDSRDLARALASSQPVNRLSEAANELVDYLLNLPESALGLNTLRFYDEYTFVHSVSVAVTGVTIGQHLGWGRDDLCTVATGCLMHDLGKLFVGQKILNKPGRLTDEERSVVQQHAQLGYEASRLLFGPGTLLNQIPYQHHERQDGTGYPRGLVGASASPNALPAGESILPIAEVASLADVYDALNSDRPYRPALPADQITGILLDLAGTSLNRTLVDEFLKLLSPYPAGAEVLIHGRDMEGFVGVVVQQDHYHPELPVVRVLYDASRGPITPQLIHMGREPQMTIESTLISTPKALRPLTPTEAANVLRTANLAARRELAGPLIC